MDTKNDKGGLPVKHSLELPERLVESYVWTTSNRKIGKYGERLCDAISQSVKQLETRQFNSGIREVIQNTDESVRITLDVRRLMANALDFNYKDAEDAVTAMQHVLFQSRYEGVWTSVPLISEARIDENKGQDTITFRVPPQIWEMFRNREHGYTLFNPLLGYRLSDSTYRLYKLLVGQSKPITHKVSDLIAMLCLNEGGMRVRRTRKSKSGERVDIPGGVLELKSSTIRYIDFCRRFLDPAKAEFEKSDDIDFTFEYAGHVSIEEREKHKKGRPQNDLITLIPKPKVPVNDDLKYVTDDYVQDNIEKIFPAQFRRYLEENFDISETEIRRSNIIIPAFQLMKSSGFADFLTDNQERFLRLPFEKRKAYLFGAIRKHVEDKYGIPLGKDRRSEDNLKAFRE